MRKLNRFLCGRLTRFIILAAEVARVRDRLDLVGIDERLIFPELDGVAARIRRYFSGRQGVYSFFAT